MYKESIDIISEDHELQVDLGRGVLTIEKHTGLKNVFFTLSIPYEIHVEFRCKEEDFKELLRRVMMP